MLNSYPADLLIMTNEKPLIVKIAVPVSICISLALAAWAGYHGWINTSWTSAQEAFLLSKIASVLMAAFGLILVFGYAGKRAGYTQDELNRWGDDALSGKPPL